MNDVKMGRSTVCTLARTATISILGVCILAAPCVGLHANIFKSLSRTQTAASPATISLRPHHRRADGNDGCELTALTCMSREGIDDQLLQFANEVGIELGDGVQLIQHNARDWGVRLTKDKAKGTTLLTVPSHAILSSSAILESTPRSDLDPLLQSMEQRMPPALLNQCRPEFLLAWKLLKECSRGPSSRWYGWMQCLPETLDTPLYYECEQAQRVVRRLAPQYVEQHQLQFEACVDVMLDVFRQNERFASALVQRFTTDTPESAHPPIDPKIQIHALRMAIKWAYSMVWSRSWRTPCAQHAMIVPVGDMFNHNSAQPNVIVRMVAPADSASGGLNGVNINPNSVHNLGSSEGGEPRNADHVIQARSSSIQVEASKDLASGDALYLSYGLTHHPGRFLVTFGFVDQSCQAIPADIIIDNGTAAQVATHAAELQLGDVFPQDELVLYTDASRGSRIPDAVWHAMLYNILLRNNSSGDGSGSGGAPRDSERFLLALKGIDTLENEGTVLELHRRYEREVALELRSHLVRLVATKYGTIRQNEPKAVSSRGQPRHEVSASTALSMLCEYNQMCRRAAEGAMVELNEVLR